MSILIATVIATLSSSAQAAPCDQKQCLKNPSGKECACKNAPQAGMGGHGKHGGMGMTEGHGPGSAQAHGFMDALEKLGLTPEQKSKIDAIHGEFAARHHAPDAKLAPEELQKDHMSMIEKMKAILTEEQIKKLDALLGEKK